MTLGTGGNGRNLLWHVQPEKIGRRYCWKEKGKHREKYKRFKPQKKRSMERLEQIELRAGWFSRMKGHFGLDYGLSMEALCTCVCVSATHADIIILAQ